MLVASRVPTELAHGHADTLQRLRKRSFGVVITSPESIIDEDLALLEEIRLVRPAVRCIVLAQHSTPEEVIAAMRARVYACFSPPFDDGAIVSLAEEAASDSEWRDDIQVISARAGWVSVRANCHMLTAERLMTFIKELSGRVPDDERQEMLQALREILLNAMEHGAAFNPDQVIYVTAVRTARAAVFYVRDPGGGFRKETLAEETIAQPEGDPTVHIQRREEAGLRPGGYGLLLAGGTVDELIYNDIGTEVVLIKYTDQAAPPPTASR
jgi:anti-sigma regulatory factor (Ser/Thr protein kinase)